MNMIAEFEPDITDNSKTSCLAVSFFSSSTLILLMFLYIDTMWSVERTLKNLLSIKTFKEISFLWRFSTSSRSLTILVSFSTTFCFKVSGESFDRINSLSRGTIVLNLCSLGSLIISWRRSLNPLKLLAFQLEPLSPPVIVKASGYS